SLQLVKRGFDVTVLTPKYKYLNTLNKQEEKKGVKIIRLLPLLEIGNAAILPQLFLILRKYDLVHVHFPFYGTGLFIFLAKIIWRKKLIIHYHMDNYASGLKDLIFRVYRFLFLPQLIKVADKIVVHSRDYAFNCQAAWWFKHYQDKLIEIPNGVDTKYYQPQNDLDKKINVRRKEILFVGALDEAHYFKGIEILLKALASTQHKEWKLNIIGNGNLVEYYQELVHTLRLDDKVFFIHNCSDQDLVKYYSRAYVTVLPSTTMGEAFGIVLVESMACQTTVIASNLPGVRTVVDNEINGLLAKPNNIESLRTKLDYLLANPDIVGRFSRAGYQKVKQRYDWQSIGDQLEKMYEDLFS
ncbi:MAG: glycosyltransferase family 4 protein, partial [Candidatus Komeilibacteria bacterium]